MIQGAARRIIEVAQRTGSDVKGPIPLPTDTSKHTSKDSREQFLMRTHRRLINVLGPTPKTVDALNQLNLPVGVDIEIKLVSAGRKPPSAPQPQVPARRTDVAGMATPDTVTPTRSLPGSNPTEPGTGESRHDSTGANVDGESGRLTRSLRSRQVKSLDRLTNGALSEGSLYSTRLDQNSPIGTRSHLAWYLLASHLT